MVRPESIQIIMCVYVPHAHALFIQRRAAKKKKQRKVNRLQYTHKLETRITQSTHTTFTHAHAKIRARTARHCAY